MMNIFLTKDNHIKKRHDGIIINDSSFPGALYKMLSKFGSGLNNITFIGEHHKCFMKKKKNKSIKYGSYCLVIPVHFESNYDNLDYLERKPVVLKFFCDKYAHSIFNQGEDFSLQDYVKKFNDDFNIIGEFLPSIYEYGYLCLENKIICSYILMKEYYTYNHLDKMNFRDRLLLCKKIIDFYIILKNNKIIVRDFKIENIGFEFVKDNFYIKIIDYDQDTFLYSNEDYVYSCLTNEHEETSHILSRLTGFYYFPYYLTINHKQFNIKNINHQLCLNMDRVSFGVLLYQIITLDKSIYYKFYNEVKDEIKNNKDLTFEQIKELYDLYKNSIMSELFNTENEIIQYEKELFNIFIKIKYLIDDSLTPYSFPDSYYTFEDPEMNDVLEEYYSLSDDDGLS